MSMDVVTAGGRARLLADGNELPLAGLGVWPDRALERQWWRS
jgi:hypothetical protein